MYNLKNSQSIEENYQNGLLPQRNQAGIFYSDTSSRSNLSNYQLSSENRRILKKTEKYSFEKIPLSEFKFTLDTQKQIFAWLKQLEWDFPISSVKKIFTDHIFNTLYIWKNDSHQVVAYSICYFSSQLSHIAYVFYNPQISHQELPIRLSLQCIIDSHYQKLNYCYLGRFHPENKIGYYKRNFPGFEYFANGQWLTYNNK